MYYVWSNFLRHDLGNKRQVVSDFCRLHDVADDGARYNSVGEILRSKYKIETRVRVPSRKRESMIGVQAAVTIGVAGINDHLYRTICDSPAE